jgi:hypothetical protein
MDFVRLAFWGAFFLLATFAFTVLFEHGTSNYFANAQKEKTHLLSWFAKKNPQSFTPGQSSPTQK